MPKFKPIHLHLLVAFCLYTTTRAEWWDDFSNNLATDLAPLLALFGERVTMQFLSESTSWLDNFIFAMAPLGVVTAVVSAIRVCGGPGLRAFIGRAQEGGGIAEAELCSSTSRDVCELYHNGAIVRVFGRPKILEVVHHHKADDFYHQLNNNNELEKPRCGIYTFREYVEETDTGKKEWKECGITDRKDCGSDLEQRGSSSDSEDDRITIWQGAKTLWRFKKLVKVQSEPSTNQEASKRATFAPNPNLSLNIGIKKHRQSVPWLAAGIGLIVQTSVTLFGGLATYYWQWEKDGARPQVWAFPLMAAGTMLLSCGMFGCAYIVERSTEERRFRKDESENRSSIYVTQPGNQTIGDQTYDAFAFSDTSTPSEPVKDYITSWKTPSQEQGKTKVWVAMGLTVVGFGLQFTGLRAMHSSVSVILLAAILIMSAVRSTLRTGRLKREQNLLYQQPDQVVGHELDWLAMQMGNTTSWSFISMLSVEQMSHPEKKVELIQSQEGAKEVITKLEMIDGNGDGWPIVCAFAAKKNANLQDQEASKALMKAETSWLSRNDLHRTNGSNKQMTEAARLFYYRSRLAELTSSPTIHSKSRLSTEWDNTLVPLRQHVWQLKTAIESSAQILFTNADVKPAWRDIKSFCWAVNVAVRLDQTAVVDPIYIFLRQPNFLSGKQSASWIVNHEYLEAALGLSVWSMVSDPVAQESEEMDLKLSAAAEVPRHRILASGHMHHKEAIDLAEREFKYWTNELPDMTSRADLFHEHIGSHAFNTSYGNRRRLLSLNRGPGAIWQRMQGDRRICFPITERTSADLSTHRGQLFRLFGWPDSLWSHRRSVMDDLPRETVLIMEAKHSMTTLCAQDIYQRFISAMAMVLDSIGGQTSLEVNNNAPCISNDVVSKLVKSIRECGLGSRQDAYAILIPALRKVLPTMADVLPEFCSIAEEDRSAGRFKKAEGILKHAYKISREKFDEDKEDCDEDQEEDEDKEDAADSNQSSKMIVLELAELYRTACRTGLLDQGMQSLRREELETFGLDGLDWIEKRASKWKRPDPVFQIIDRYITFGRLWRMESSERIFTTAEVLEAFAQHRRGECFLKLSRARKFVHLDSRGRDVLSLASENGWLEVVTAILHMGYKVDVEDSFKRTALSYASQHGHNDVVEVLIKRQADPDARDLNGRTPLSYASENGQVEAMRILINESDVSVDATDTIRTSLHWAAAGGHIPSLELLLEKRANIEAHDEKGQTPYITALVGRKLDAAQFLLANGAKHTPKVGQQDAWRWAFRNGKWGAGNFMLRLWCEKAQEMSAERKRVGVLVHLMSNNGTHDNHTGQLLFDPNPKNLTSFVVCEMDANGTVKRADSATLLKVLRECHHLEVWIYEFKGLRMVNKYKLGDPHYHSHVEVMNIDRISNPTCTQRDKVEALLSFLPSDTRITAGMCQAVARNSVGLELYSKDHLETMGLLLEKGGMALRNELGTAMDTMEGHDDLRPLLQRMDRLSL
ncbi:hypothetical protein CcaCcLH18_06728 [Colletotrichum camelliae]|nr:hypothetical protein CcaCcLH18_06728 [Colletotrichum camelliae]